jgi:VWFA-related protein
MMPAFFLALLLLLAPAGSSPQDLPSRSEPVPSPFQISVDLNLVVLPVTVRDKNGGFASDLRQQDFQIYEDGVLQSIRIFQHEDVPVTVGLVIDHSGSMLRKIDDVVAAAQTFVHLSNTDDQMFVVNFNEHVSLGLPASVPFTNRADKMESAILEAPVSGQTALYDAIDLALDRLQAGRHAKKVLVVISDGGDNASTHTLPQILKKAELSNAIVYTIGIFEPVDPDQNPGVLRRLARETGGEAFFPAQVSEGVSNCQDIAKDIRYQYAVGYVSESKRSGGQRSVRVAVRAAGRDLVVRTRTGYIAPRTAPDAGTTRARTSK